MFSNTEFFLGYVQNRRIYLKSNVKQEFIWHEFIWRWIKGLNKGVLNFIKIGTLIEKCMVSFLKSVLASDAFPIPLSVISWKILPINIVSHLKYLLAFSRISKLRGRVSINLELELFTIRYNILWIHYSYVVTTFPSLVMWKVSCIARVLKTFWFSL